METLQFAEDLIRAGRPFAAHEVLEARWKACPQEERELWQGLAQLCVGLTHAARGNEVGAARLVERGTDRLVRYDSTAGPRYGLDIRTIVNCAQNAVSSTETDGRHSTR